MESCGEDIDKLPHKRGKVILTKKTQSTNIIDGDV